MSATAPVANGAVTVYPGGTARPDTPTLHVRSDGQPTTTTAWLRLGQRGTLSTWADAGTNLAVDVAGYVVGRPADPDPAVAPTAPTITGSDAQPAFDDVIERFLRTYGVPGASVTVAQDGRIVYARGYGAADPTTGAPVQVDSRFRYASTSKLFTTAEVLELVQAGQLSLDDHVFGLLAPRSRCRRTPTAASTTSPCRELLGHTRGCRRRRTCSSTRAASPRRAARTPPAGW